MIVTYNWLKEYVNFDLPVKELATKLTSVGPEVVAIKPVGISKQNADKIFLAKVNTLEKHPKADNLVICTLTVNRVNHKVITNSKTVEKGDFVVYSKPGTHLYSGMEVKVATIKGEDSDGMLLAKESLNIEEKSSDIWILGKDEKKAKTLFETYAEEDYILEIELTANRSDCLSVIGIAREVSAMLDKEMNVPRPSIQETLEEIPNIQIMEKNLCPRYSARVLRGVEVKESPEWMKRKLTLCGIRPINNLVDVTNYVLLEYGHPMHAFDLSRLAGEKIIVRAAENNEHFKTLDSKDHKLTNEMLVIADEKKAVALAGIMGGENSEIISTTKDILLESAFFDPLSIRKTAKKLGIKTESSHRFERTADWGVTTAAIERATELVLTTCSPKVSRVRDEYVNIFKDRIINVKEDFVSTKIGVELSIKEIENILKRLKFSIVAKREDTLEAKVPTFRSDISKTIDIVEEVARIYGYNAIPAPEFKPPVDVESLKPKKEIQEKIRDILSGQGFTEAYNHTFTNDEDLKLFKAQGDNLVKLQNPLTQDASVLRNHLYYGLVKAIDYNVKNAYRSDLRFFEIGRTFLKQKNSYIETRKACFALYGPSYNYYTAEGIMELILKKVGNQTIDFNTCALPFLHPVNSSEILFNGKSIGFLGEVHPEIAESLGLRYPLYTAEFETSALNDYLNEPQELKAFSKFPPTTRDLSVVVDSKVLARRIMNAIKEIHEWIAAVDFVDLFKGVQIGADKKSLTFSIVFQSQEKTLNDQEVGDIMEKINSQLKSKFGAELRS